MNTAGSVASWRQVPQPGMPSVIMFVLEVANDLSGLRQRPEAGEVIEFSDEFLAGDGALNHSTKAFAGVLIDDGHELDRSCVGGGVELEVHGPHPVGRIGDHGVRCSGAAVVFAASSLRYPQPFHAT